MIRYEHHYYDGAWQKPSTTDSIDVLSSATEEAIGRVPKGNAEDVDRAVKSARTGVRRRVGADHRRRARGVARQAGRGDEGAGAAGGRSDHPRSRYGDRFCDEGAGRIPDLRDRAQRQVHPRVSLRRRARQFAHRQGSGRRRRLRHAVELPAASDCREDRAGACRRMHRGAQTGGDCAAERADAGRRGPRDRACPPACSTSSAARVASSARPLSVIRTSTW